MFSSQGRICAKSIFIALFLTIISCFPQPVTMPPQNINATNTNNYSSPALPQPSLPTSTADFHYLINCISINDISTTSQKLEGYIILDNRGKIETTDVLEFNLKNQDKKHIQKEGERIFDIRESPDKTQISYRLYNSVNDSSFLIVDDISLHRKTIYAWKEEWDRILGWADSKNIVISKANTENLDKFPELIVININTQNEKIISPNFPSMYDLHPIPFWKGFQGTTYDKEFTRATYMRWLEEKGGLVAYSLWDMEKQSELINFLVAEYPIPLWSPDSSQFIVTKVINIDNISYKDLVSITRDGKITQLTYLNEQNPNSEVVSYSWSPNGQFIALLIRKVGQNKASVAVLDTKTLTLYDYCISSVDTENSFNPLWSPDSHQMLVQVWITTDQSEVILIDITKKYAVKIAKDYEPLAWLKE